MESSAWIVLFSFFFNITISQLVYAEEITFYHNDALCSTVSMTDINGTVVWTQDYLPFGGEARQTGTDITSHKYTGKELDEETGLYYYGARFYDPKIGRFISVDPSRLDGGNNLYAYVKNNPYKYVDRWGLDVHPAISAAGQVLGDIVSPIPLTKSAMKVTVANVLSDVAATKMKIGMMLLLTPEPSTSVAGLYLIVSGLATGAGAYYFYGDAYSDYYADANTPEYMESQAFKNMKRTIKDLERYIRQHQGENLKEDPNYQYLLNNLKEANQDAMKAQELIKEKQVKEKEDN